MLAMDTKIEKKPYTPPELIEYGNLIEITRTGIDDGNDTAGFGSTPTG
jgi:hypothetical protein